MTVAGGIARRQGSLLSRRSRVSIAVTAAPTQLLIHRHHGTDCQLIDLYSLVIVVAVIVSWIPLDPRHPLAAVVYGLTEPVLAPIRRALPPMGGLDLSPMVLMIALQILKSLLV